MGKKKLLTIAMQHVCNESWEAIEYKLVHVVTMEGMDAHTEHIPSGAPLQTRQVYVRNIAASIA